MIDRRHFLEAAALAGAASTLFPGALYARHVRESGGGPGVASAEITLATIQEAEQLAGLSFTDAQREQILDRLKEARVQYDVLRETPLPNHVLPSLVFNPDIGGLRPQGMAARAPISWTPPPAAGRPDTEEDLAFAGVARLSALLKARLVTSVELTELCLARLRRFDPVLKCVVSLTADRALRQARAADAELDAGHWRGPLHGIPWGAKDLLSTRGYPTTWGAKPYEHQVLDEDADVVRLLDDAGAVLVAKLTLGALAMGDVWFGGTTKTPWNTERGSSGSSAGPGSAVAAGCVPFAIGSETLGSIVSPSNRNGVTGLRPTFGRISRTGAMTLSWTMDKLGPMCRSAEDCALVFGAIHGASPSDPTSITMPFEWPPERHIQDLRVGVVDVPDYRNTEADRSIHGLLRSHGVALRPVTLPDRATGPMLQMLRAEAAAAFDDLIRSGRADELVRQDDGAWPATFRAARFIPAVEYINASRARTLLMQDMRAVFRDVDVVVVPTFGANQLAITNLTGHPSITFPNTVAAPDGQVESLTIIGDLYRDQAVLAVAAFIQSNTSFHLERPALP
ncbi:MAG: amidase [Rhodothermales bacterium]